MKIAFIGQKGIHSLSGGVEKHVENIAVRLADLGHDVTVYTRARYIEDGAREYRGVRLVVVPAIETKHLAALTQAFCATLHAIFCSRYDIIHYHSIGPSTLAILPRLLKPSARVIATFHSRDYFHKKWNAFARLCLRAAEYLTCVVPEKTIVISETLSAYATRTYRKEFVMIPNGAQIKREENTDYLLGFGLWPGRYMLSVCRLVRHKGVHLAVKAFAELEASGKLPNNFKLAIVGSPAYSEEYRDYLEALAAGHPNIVFLGERKGAELDALYSHAAFFLQTSEDEGLSLALLEAMAHGLLPVVSNIPANLEAIGEAGVSFQSESVESLKEPMAYFANRQEEAALYGEKAQVRAERLYSWDAIARRTLGVYEEALLAASSVRALFVRSK